MLEPLIGIFLIGTSMWLVYFFYEKGWHLADFDREMRKILPIDGSGHSLVLLKRTAQRPSKYTGFALYDGASKFLCYDGGPRLLCEYNQILEWRIFVNNRSVACLSRLTSSDLKVEEPDRTLSTEEFLKKYCDDHRPEPVLESVTLKFLLRDLSYPVHTISLTCIERQPSLENCLTEALSLVDKFKVLMYSHRPV